VLRPAGTLAGASADAVAQSIDEPATTADMVVVDLEAAHLPDAKAVPPSTTCHHPAVISSTQATSWRRLRTSKTWSQWGA